MSSNKVVTNVFFDLPRVCFPLTSPSNISRSIIHHMEVHEQSKLDVFFLFYLIKTFSTQFDETSVVYFRFNLFARFFSKSTSRTHLQFVCNSKTISCSSHIFIFTALQLVSISNSVIFSVDQFFRIILRRFFTYRKRAMGDDGETV